MPVAMSGTAGVIDFGTAASAPYSPLDQLGMVMQMDNSPLTATLAAADDSLAAKSSSSSSPTATTSPLSSSVTPATSAIPALDFKLFRSPSIYSVESGDSLSIASMDDAGERYGFRMTGEPDSSDESDMPLSSSPHSNDEAAESTEHFYTPPLDEEDVITFSTPSTPRARRTFGAGGPSAGGSPATSGTATPTAARIKTEHRTDPCAPTLPYAPGTLRSAVSEAPFALRPVPVRSARSTSISTTSSPSTTSPPCSAVRASSEPVPPAVSPTAGQVASPRYPERAVAPDWASVHGEQGSDWGEDESGFEWLDSSDAPHADTLNTPPHGQQRRLVRHLTRRLSAVGVKAANTAAGLVASASTAAATSPPTRQSDLGSSNAQAPAVDSSSSSTDDASAPAAERRNKKKRSYVIPRRAPPPPPPTGGITVVPVAVTRSRSPGTPRAGGAANRNSPSPDATLDVTSTPTKSHDNGRTNMAHNSNGAEEQALPPVVVINATPPRQGSIPTMVPLKNAELASAVSASMHKSASHQSGYSFYDLDDSPARSSDPQSSGTFPRGRYARVPLYELNGTPLNDSSENVRSRVTTPTKHSRRPSADDALSATARRPLRSPDSSSALSRSHTTARRAPTMAEADMMTADELVAAGLQRREAGDKPKSAWLFMKAAEQGSVTGQIHWGIALRHG